MLLKSSGTRRAFRGQKARYPKIEEKLLEYVSEKRQFRYTVSTEMCQLKALALVKEQGIDSFKASRGWIMRFFTRNELCIKIKTSVSQRLPDAYEEKILCFQKYIINLWWHHSYTVSQIGNTDQTLVYFEMPLNTTVHKKGDNTCHEILIRYCLLPIKTVKNFISDLVNIIYYYWYLVFWTLSIITVFFQNHHR
jgi:hypothetical protein